ncbi:MAG: polysaccharide deacetylase family protein [Magnetococcales bacterium]|nr:polysaccharide deacetylase family protein [Magnetococcales bacterium]
MPILTLFLRRIGWLALLFAVVQPLPVAYGKMADDSRPAAKYHTAQFTPHFLYPGGEVVLTVDGLNQPEERVMALTFDDGPDVQDLETVALLKKKGIQATFFYIGSKVKALPDVVQAVFGQQHEIGYHSFRHQRLSGFSQTGLEEDFRQGKAALSSLGVPLNLFRPPYGAFNDKVVHTAKAQGMETVLWTIDSRDWTGVSPAAMARNVIQQFHPGAVLLFHSQHPATLQALPLVLAAAEREQYRFVSLGDWRQTILAANCRMAGRSCPATPTSAAAAPTPASPPEKVTAAAASVTPDPPKPSPVTPPNHETTPPTGESVVLAIESFLPPIREIKEAPQVSVRSAPEAEWDLPVANVRPGPGEPPPVKAPTPTAKVSQPAPPTRKPLPGKNREPTLAGRPQLTTTTAPIPESVAPVPATATQLQELATVLPATPSATPIPELATVDTPTTDLALAAEALAPLLTPLPESPRLANVEQGPGSDAPTFPESAMPVLVPIPAGADLTVEAEESRATAANEAPLPVLIPVTIVNEELVATSLPTTDLATTPH